MTIFVKVVGQERVVKIEDAETPAMVSSVRADGTCDPDLHWLRIKSSANNWMFNMSHVDFYYTEQEVTPQCEDS